MCHSRCHVAETWILIIAADAKQLSYGKHNLFTENVVLKSSISLICWIEQLSNT